MMIHDHSSVLHQDVIRLFYRMNPDMGKVRMVLWDILTDATL